MEGCPTYGNQDGPLMNTPNDACCYCGGGLPIQMECMDIPDFVDSSGDSCDWYTRYDSYGCPTYGDSFSNRETGLAANDACCYCGGGIEGSIPAPSLSPSLSIFPSNSISSLPTKKPTSDPSALPTLILTMSPTLLSTQMLSSNPTTLPTKTPTNEPIYEPFMTMNPTNEPTELSMSRPTLKPIKGLSPQPITTPTYIPSKTSTGELSPSIPSLVPSSSFMKKLTDEPSINPSQLFYLTPSLSVSSRPTINYEASSIRPSLLSTSPTQNKQNYPSTYPRRLSSFPPSLLNNLNNSSTHSTLSPSPNVVEVLSMDPSVSAIALSPPQSSLPNIRSSMPTDMIKGTPKVSVNGSLSISPSALFLILFCFIFLFAFI